MSYTPIDPSVLAGVLNNQGTLSSESTQSKVYNALGTLASSGTRATLYSPAGNPVDVAIDSNGEYHLGVTAVQSVYASTKNSSTGTLAASGSFVGTVETTLGIAGIQVMLRSDQNCTVYVDQSGNGGTDWDVSDGYTYLSSKGGQSWTTQAVGSEFRVRAYNSGSVATGYFRLFTALCPIVEAVPRALSANGNFQVDIMEMLETFGTGVKSTPTGALKVAPSTRLVGATFQGTVIDTNFWGSTATGSGTIAQTGGQLVLGTRTIANSSGTLTSVRSARYVAAHTSYYRAVVRCPAATGDNTRRWGAYGALDGFFFEVQNGIFSVVCRKAGSDVNKVSATNWNGAIGINYVLDTNVHTYEIYWTNKSAWFLIDDVIAHKFSGNTAPLTDTNTLNVTSECANTAGNTAVNSLEVRVSSISRLGSVTSQPILKNVTGPRTVILKYGAGNLHRMMVNTAGAAGATAALYDSTGAPGPVAAALAASWGTFNTGVGSSNTISGQGNFTWDFMGAPFYTGLTIVTTGSGNLNVIYE